MAKPTNHRNQGINLIVRSLILHDGHILLSTATAENKDFSQGFYFLPGGHVDHNESARDALKREIKEEMGYDIESDSLAAVLECSWDRKGSTYHELNLVYVVDIQNLNLKKPPNALDHAFQRFVWVPVKNLHNISILPETLTDVIYDTLKDGEKKKFYSQMLENKAA
jgi:8-oxo-dGTP diphosphatase